MDIYPSYTYYLRWTSQNKSYYGVRTANKVAPHDDLWSHYFTSSKSVEAFRKEYGEPDIILIDEIFKSREDAVAYEIEYLKQNNWKSDEWLNQACFPNCTKIPWNKGKQLSEETKKKMSEARKGRKITEEQKLKISETLKRNSFLRIHSETTKHKQSLAKKGKPRSAETKSKISETLKGRVLSKKHRRNISESIKKWRAKDNC